MSGALNSTHSTVQVFFQAIDGSHYSLDVKKDSTLRELKENLNSKIPSHLQVTKILLTAGRALAPDEKKLSELLSDADYLNNSFCILTSPRSEPSVIPAPVAAPAPISEDFYVVPQSASPAVEIAASNEGSPDHPVSIKDLQKLKTACDHCLMLIQFGQRTVETSADQNNSFLTVKQFVDALETSQFLELFKQEAVQELIQKINDAERGAISFNDFFAYFFAQKDKLREVISFVQSYADLPDVCLSNLLPYESPVALAVSDLDADFDNHTAAAASFVSTSPVAADLDSKVKIIEHLKQIALQIKQMTSHDFSLQTACQSNQFLLFRHIILKNIEALDLQLISEEFCLNTESLRTAISNSKSVHYLLLHGLARVNDLLGLLGSDKVPADWSTYRAEKDVPSSGPDFASASPAAVGAVPVFPVQDSSICSLETTFAHDAFPTANALLSEDVPVLPVASEGMHVNQINAFLESAEKACQDYLLANPLKRLGDNSGHYSVLKLDGALKVLRANGNQMPFNIQEFSGALQGVQVALTALGLDNPKNTKRNQYFGRDNGIQAQFSRLSQAFYCQFPCPALPSTPAASSFIARAFKGLLGRRQSIESAVVPAPRAEIVPPPAAAVVCFPLAMPVMPPPEAILKETQVITEFLEQVGAKTIGPLMIMNADLISLQADLGVYLRSINQGVQPEASLIDRIQWSYSVVSEFLMSQGVDVSGFNQLFSTLGQDHHFGCRF